MKTKTTAAVEQQVIYRSIAERADGATHEGRSFPLGAAVEEGGVNFSVFSRTASSLELLLFNRVDDARPASVIPLDPVRNRTYHYWHTFVPGLKAGQLYAYRAYGPHEPQRGLRFN